jgi:transposase
MLMLPSKLRVLICCEAVDMRKSFDSLAEIVRSVLSADPVSGHLFVFFSKNFSSAKILQWERGGFWIYYRRLEKGTFRLPVRKGTCSSLEVSAHELSLILEGLELDGAKHRVRFERTAV